MLEAMASSAALSEEASKARVSEEASILGGANGISISERAGISANVSEAAVASEATSVSDADPVLDSVPVPEAFASGASLVPETVARETAAEPKSTDKSEVVVDP